VTRKLFTILVCSILLQTYPALAQNNSSNGEGVPSCGDPAIKFDVITDKPGSAAQPEPGKALVYFVEDDVDLGSPKPTTRIGIDGAWAGANHGNSFFSVSVSPGVHHLCASWQTGIVIGQAGRVAALHFTADAGGVYYFEVKNRNSDTTFKPLDGDEGQLLASRFSLAAFHPKK
jgi:hypothetical protein